MTDYWLSSHGKCGWNGGPQADEVGEQQLSKIGQQLKENNFAPWMICEPNEKEGKKLLEEIKELKIKD